MAATGPDPIRPGSGTSRVEIRPTSHCRYVSQLELSPLRREASLNSCLYLSSHPIQPQRSKRSLAATSHRASLPEGNSGNSARRLPFTPRRRDHTSRPHSTIAAAISAVASRTGRRHDRVCRVRRRPLGGNRESVTRVRWVRYSPPGSSREPVTRVSQTRYSPLGSNRESVTRVSWVRYSSPGGEP